MASRRTARPRSALLLAGLLLAPAALLSGCGDDPAGPGPGGDDVLELVFAADDLQLLAALVAEVGLDVALRTEPDLTLFAPTDEALLDLGPEMLASLNGPNNRDVLRKLLRRHLVRGRLRVADLADGAVLTPLEGPPLAVRVEGEAVTVGGALITDEDFAAGNGVVHQIDELVRDHLTLAERLRVTPLVATFAAAVGTADLTGLVSSGEPYTLLIPINSAFANLDAAEFESLLRIENRDLLQKVLRHHILPGRVREEAFTDGATLATLGGLPLGVEVDAEDNIVYVGGARVIVPEVETSDGLIYLLDAVVLSHLDLTERLRASRQHTIFYEILSRAGFLSSLRGEGPFTVFAPTDLTLAPLGESFVVELQRRPDLFLRTVQYYIVPDRIGPEELLGRSALTTLGGYSLPVSTSNNGGALSITLGSRGRVSLPPKETKNGFLYSIDSFLLPPGLDLSERAIFAGLYRFLNVMEAAGLTSLLSEEGPFTVFAPSNEALQSVGFPDAHRLRYHIVPGRYDVTQLALLAGTSLPTLAGADLPITFDPLDGLFIGSTQPVSQNNVAVNGIIHAIDGVLTPP